MVSSRRWRIFLVWCLGSFSAADAMTSSSIGSVSDIAECGADRATCQAHAQFLTLIKSPAR